MAEPKIPSSNQRAAQRVGPQSEDLSTESQPDKKLQVPNAGRVENDQSPMHSDMSVDSDLNRELFESPIDAEFGDASQGDQDRPRVDLGQLDGTINATYGVPESQTTATGTSANLDHSSQDLSKAIATISQPEWVHDRSDRETNKESTIQKATPHADIPGNLDDNTQHPLQMEMQSIMTPHSTGFAESTPIVGEAIEKRDSSATSQTDIPEANMVDGDEQQGNETHDRTSARPAVQPAGEHTIQRANQMTFMPPPSAPASMLWSLKSSSRAKWLTQKLNDPAIYRRLISVTVILFSQGRAKESKAVGQFTIDLIGEVIWNEELPSFMEAAALPDDKDSIFPLLNQAAEIIKVHDPVSSAFLDGLMSLMD